MASRGLCGVGGSSEVDVDVIVVVDSLGRILFAFGGDKLLEGGERRFFDELESAKGAPLGVGVEGTFGGESSQSMSISMVFMLLIVALLRKGDC